MMTAVPAGSMLLSALDGYEDGGIRPRTERTEADLADSRDAVILRELLEAASHQCPRKH